MINYKERMINMKGYEDLSLEWEELSENLRCSYPELDSVKRLIFDTYHFLKNGLKGDSVPRNRLELYKYIGQVCQSLETDYPLGLTHGEAITFQAFAMGLCFMYEHGFIGFGDNPLQTGLNMHIPAGCSDPEADMTTYESFEKDFNKNIEWIHED